MSFTADHHGFYQKGHAFYPLVQDKGTPVASWSNVMTVLLPAQLHDDLDWTKALACAQKYIAAGKSLLWEIDLGLSSYPLDPQDTAAFLSFTVALEEFSAKIWPKMREQTFGVVLYRGAFDPAVSFPSVKWEAAYCEWKEATGIDDYSLYCAQKLAEYLHRLVSFLPDEVLPFAMFDLTSISSLAKKAQLFSRERFAHTHLIIKGAGFPFSGIAWDSMQSTQGWLGSGPANASLLTPPPIAIYFPKDPMICAEICSALDRLMTSLQVPFRLICEEKLTEEWDGLDRLFVISKSVSSQGRRKLLGFIAAGGIVCTLGEPLGLPDEEIIFF